MGFKKGDKVLKYLSGAGHVTHEEGVVSRVNKKGVWLDNGPGNDESGPFNPVTGVYADNWMPGWSSYIKLATD